MPQSFKINKNQGKLDSTLMHMKSTRYDSSSRGGPIKQTFNKKECYDEWPCLTYF